MAKFKALKGQVKMIPKEFLQNKDTENLMYLSLLVQTGPKASPEILKVFDCCPGIVSFARWITTANNVLCLYCQTSNPSKELILLTQVIINIYAPMLFDIKVNWHISYGAIHFFNTLMLSRNFLKKSNPDLFEIVLKEMRINGFTCHPESIILAMIHDPTAVVRQKGIKLIEKLRNQKPGANIRLFQVPPFINFEAKNYHQLINFDDFTEGDWCSPPLLSTFSIDEIKNLQFNRDYDMIPCHSQHVERFVSLTSLAAENAIGEDNRHCWILNKVETTSKNPLKSPKNHYVNQVNKDKEKVKRDLFNDKVE